MRDLNRALFPAKGREVSEPIILAEFPFQYVVLQQTVTCYTPDGEPITEDWLYVMLCLVDKATPEPEVLDAAMKHVTDEWGLFTVREHDDCLLCYEFTR